MGRQGKYATAWSDSDWASWSEYAADLGLEDEPCDGVVPLPYIEAPILFERDARTLDLWRSHCLSEFISGTWLIKLSTITLKDLEAFSGWTVLDEGLVRKHFLRGAVKHLREQVEVKNRRLFLSYDGKARNSKLCSLAKSLWPMPLTDLERTIEAKLGLFGSSYSEVIAATTNILEGGVAELKKGLSRLRNIADDEERAAAFAQLVTTADSSPLDRLVYLAQGQVLKDLHGHELGAEGELRLEDQLRDLHVDFLNEAQQREAQVRLFGKLRFPTPDILFPKLVRFLGVGEPVRWLDSKATVVVPGFTMGLRVEKFNEQLDKLVAHFDAGAIIWMYGHSSSLHRPEGVTYLRPPDSASSCSPEAGRHENEQPTTATVVAVSDAGGFKLDRFQ
mmetsp:Transcript_110413/g.352021  ORF Transcript_110413/g.352021 Transcript_110413/m.352021 type:complete len:391 (+) Transcript_110413:69-1241(+)